MRKAQFEAEVGRILKKVVDRKAVEDGHVELKALYTDPSKTARRIAGMANAANEEDCILLVGVDEKAGTVPGVQNDEWSGWWKNVQTAFDGAAPTAKCEIAVEWGGVVVRALLLATDGAPYVVRNPSNGKVPGETVELEVPWRTAGHVRSASRANLLQLLYPASRRPEVQLLHCKAEAQFLANEPDIGQVTVRWTVYLNPVNDRRIVLPRHLMKASIDGAQGYVGIAQVHEADAPQVIVPSPSPTQGVTLARSSTTIEGTTGELVIHGPGIANFGAYTHMPRAIADATNKLNVILGVAPLDKQWTISLPAELELRAPQALGSHVIYRWEMRSIHDVGPSFAIIDRN